MNITRLQSPSFAKGRAWTGGAQITPDTICDHLTGNTTQSAINTVMNRANGVSYHFIIAGADFSGHGIVPAYKDGDIFQFVSIEDTAWANGTNNTAGDNRNNAFSTLAHVRDRRMNANLYTISIGFGDMNLNGWQPTPKQIESAAWLKRHIRDEIQRIYGAEMALTRDFIVGHDEITPLHRPNCPGRNFPWGTIMNRLQENVPTQAPQGLLFRVQVGAFRQRANAAATLDRLKEAGHEDAFIASDGSLFRVQVGAFAERVNAIRLENELKTQGFDTFITTVAVH